MSDEQSDHITVTFKEVIGAHKKKTSCRRSTEHLSSIGVDGYGSAIAWSLLELVGPERAAMTLARALAELSIISDPFDGEHYPAKTIAVCGDLLDAAVVLVNLGPKAVYVEEKETP